MLLKKLLSMVDQTKKDFKMSGWLHMPPTSIEFQYYKLLCRCYQSKSRRLTKLLSECLREDEGILKMECEMLVKKLMSMVDQTKKDLKMSGWLHMPPTSFEYQYYKLLCRHYESSGYIHLGFVASLDQTKPSIKGSITYYQKAKTIYNLHGLGDEAKLMDTNIAILKDCLASCDGDSVNVAVNAITKLKDAKYKYEYSMKTCGLTSERTLRSGLIYVTIFFRHTVVSKLNGSL